MKIKPEHVAYLRERIVPLDSPERRECYRKGQFPRADKVKDLDRRYRWDLVYSVPGLIRWMCVNLYPYANNDHIDTALRSIVPGL